VYIWQGLYEQIGEEFGRHRRSSCFDFSFASLPGYWNDGVLTKLGMCNYFFGAIDGFLFLTNETD
jgi:hypothetical protein